MLLRKSANNLPGISYSNAHGSPGAIYTPIQVDTRDPNSMEGWGSNKQLGRPGQPSEVAPSFVFLASKDATFYCMDLSSVLFKPLSRH
jgi:NAD(P)-dependent dehydrogenase (short-subunit alcohol dehydrogenase family)